MNDFRHLWFAAAVSTLGTAIGYSALPLVALLILEASALQVSLLAALSAIAGALISLPFGTALEYRRKRPVMIAMDLLRFVALGSVPIAAAAGVLSYPQLCVVAVLNAAALMTFNAASGSYLKALLGPDEVGAANARLESTFWMAYTAGPPIGGWLIGVLGATAAVAVDAVSFLVSALGLRRARHEERVPVRDRAGTSYRRDLTAGWRYVLGEPDLRMLFANALLFGGAVLMTGPLLAVLMLRDLHFSPLWYGLVFGVSCLGGVLGAWLAPRLTRRFGARRVLLWSGLLRVPWLLLMPFAQPGVSGLVLLTAAEFGLLVAAGVFNPSFTTHRMRRTPDHLMARVQLSWSISARLVQPLFIAAGGVLASMMGVASAIGVAGVLCAASAALLPWRTEAQPLRPRQIHRASR